VIAAAALAVTLATFGAVASPGRSPARVGLTASPTHIVLGPGGRQVVRVTASGGGVFDLRAHVAGFSLDLRGRPKIAAAGDAAPWVTVSPRSITVGRAGGSVVVSVREGIRGRPGDHSALVLLSAVAPSARGVVVRMRIGLVVQVRMPGRLVHRVAILAARVRQAGRLRTLEVTLANRGNVIEAIAAHRLRVALVRRGRVIARYLGVRRELLPKTKALMGFRCGGHARGVVEARIELWRGGVKWVERRFRLRL
jgi:hypothetical protein